MVQPSLGAYRWQRTVEYEDFEDAVAKGLKAARQLVDEKWRVTRNDEPWR